MEARILATIVNKNMTTRTNLELMAVGILLVTGLGLAILMSI
jgi:hypothetical protein